MILNDLSKHFLVVECFITLALSKGIAIGYLTIFRRQRCSQGSSGTHESLHVQAISYIAML